ncbi:MAG: cell division protein ZapA [Thiomonas sp.]|uniref:cell division protein ZapA n=1 Tax=Thiomonas sp. TaxID=2047785 RepID=UPI002A3711B5|nr:cell division protein ZapA [Thiomonas sp.]MDY0329893.1 cell division protein ZapA [Thiomonas sp.]
MSMTTLDVNIMGQIYTLACPADEQAALLAAVREVDTEMCAIRDMGKVRARERIAVLAALNLAHSLIEARKASEAAGEAIQAPLTSGEDAKVIAQLTRQLDEALGAEGKLL